ncbi:hypothetical protein L511_0111 [Bordetella bronchiseptica MBORD595]|nr:hypothetical protein L511_0111 [Bordetella bronchiseptica MBORD595]
MTRPTRASASWRDATAWMACFTDYSFPKFTIDPPCPRAVALGMRHSGRKKTRRSPAWRSEEMAERKFRLPADTALGWTDNTCQPVSYADISENRYRKIIWIRAVLMPAQSYGYVGYFLDRQPDQKRQCTKKMEPFVMTGTPLNSGFCQQRASGSAARRIRRAPLPGRIPCAPSSPPRMHQKGACCLPCLPRPRWRWPSRPGPSNRHR